MKTAKGQVAAADDYLRCVSAFPLRAIRSADEQAAAVRVHARLAGRVAPPLSDGEREYVDALARLIHDFDLQVYPDRPRKRTSPQARLKYVLSESGTTPTRLAGLLDVSPSLVSLILSGRRNLTVEHVRRLSKHFKIDAGYFI